MQSHTYTAGQILIQLSTTHTAEQIKNCLIIQLSKAKTAYRTHTAEQIKNCLIIQLSKSKTAYKTHHTAEQIKNCL